MASTHRAVLVALIALLASGCNLGRSPSPGPSLDATPATGGSGPVLGPGSSGAAVASPTAVRPTPTPSGLPFRIAATQPAVVAGHLLPYWVGIDTGLFRDQRLAVELLTVQSDQVALTAAGNGSIDAVISTPSPTLLAVIGSGVDAVIVGATHNGFDQRLLAASEVTVPGDMVGRTVVISQKSTLNDFQTREALERIGVDPDRDLFGWWMGANQAERVQNLRLGNGQATVVTPPLSVLLAREGFTDFGDLSQGPPWPGAAIVVARQTYVARNQYFERFLQGLLASIQRTKADPALAQQVLARHTSIDDAEATAVAYEVYGDRLLERVPYISMEGLQRAVEFSKQGRPEVLRLQAARLVDQTILQRIESTGYVNTLYR
jgi:ABC-type nitrate/sulfonate/bicarbonate transport system substrate-binding protein